MILIGLVQGITEWLPISSTGHMILLGELLSPPGSQEFFDFFLVAVQLGSALAVAVIYFDRLCPLGPKKETGERRASLRLILRILIACFPVALVGFLFDDLIFRFLYRSEVVAASLLGYGILFLFLERKRRARGFRVCAVEALSVWDALAIGTFQVLSLIPGTSRSGSTIIGAMLLGVDRRTAAEFSFFLSLPVMAGASLLEGVRFFSSGLAPSPHEVFLLLLGGCVAFLTSLCVIRFLLGFVERHRFSVFGLYRIVLGVILLLRAYL